MPIVELPKIDPSMDPPVEEIPSFKWPDLSPYAREIRSWETRNRIPGYDPKNYRYPMDMYKASRKTDAEGNAVGKLLVVDPYDESALKRNTRKVKTEAEEKQALAEGWCESPAEALRRATKDEDEISRVAAHRRYEDRGMSESAKREMRQAEEDAGMDHVPAKPEARKARKKPGPKPKLKAAEPPPA